MKRVLLIAICAWLGLPALAMPQRITLLGVGRKAAAAAIPYITGQTLGTLRSNFTGCVGLAFTTPASSPPTITSLGRWKVSGNTGTHTVSLINDTDDALVASVSINTTLGTAGTYQYASITPALLIASKRYALVSAETNAGDQWYDNNTTITTDSVFGTQYGHANGTGTECNAGVGLNTTNSGNVTYGPPNLTR